MTVGELIDALKRFDPTDLVVVEDAYGDYVPMTDCVTRVRIGEQGEEGEEDEFHQCAAIFSGEWPEGTVLNFAIREDDQ